MRLHFLKRHNFTFFIFLKPLLQVYWEEIRCRTVASCATVREEVVSFDTRAHVQWGVQLFCGLTLIRCVRDRRRFPVTCRRHIQELRYVTRETVNTDAASRPRST